MSMGLMYISRYLRDLSLAGCSLEEEANGSLSFKNNNLVFPKQNLQIF
jgi:hypothetical protein